MRLWYEFERRFGNVVRLEPDALCVSAASEILSLAKKGHLKSPFMASSLAYRLVAGMFDDMGAGLGGGTAGLPPFARKVMDFCLERYADDIGVEEMAEVSGYSRYHFCRAFKKAVGDSPGSFLRDLRLKQALRMLQMERMNVKEIASRCGFEDGSHFCKSFKRVYGATPDAFRRGSGS